VFISCISEGETFETRFYGDIGRVYIIRANRVWEPVPKPKMRSGREGYSARIKKDIIIVDRWSGKKQKHMEMQLSIAEWPVCPLAQHEIAERMIAEMAKHTFNEDWGPHMDRQADEVVRAINKAYERYEVR
jgi:hypothetical protein